MIGLADPASALRLTEQIAAAGVAVSSLEWLAQPAKMSDGGMFSWEVLQARGRWLVVGWKATMLRAAFRYPNVLGLHALRLALAAGLLLSGHTPALRAPCLLGLAGLALLLRLRSPVGLDGSDQMSSIVLVSLGMTYVIGTPLVRTLCVWFLAAEVVLAYGTAGGLKAREAGWRDGTYLAKVLSSRTYGHPRLGPYLTSHSRIARVMSIGTVSLECSLPLALVVPRPAAVVLLAGGVVFHVSTAAIMGLNTFVWSFLATYPAVWCCVSLRGW